MIKNETQSGENFVARRKRLRVSLVTACFNSEGTIHRTLGSVVSQGGDYELEHVIQDGGSSDRTLDVIEAYSDEVGNSTDTQRSALMDVSMRSGRDAGFYDAINQGIQRATGDIVGLINADDWLADENVLADVVQLFEENSGIDAVYGDLEYVTIRDLGDIKERHGASVGRHEGSEVEGAKSQNGRAFADDLSPFNQPHSVRRRWVSGAYSIAGFKNGWMPPHPTVYVRKEVYEKLGAYRLDMGTAADYEWMLRTFVKHRIQAAYLPRVAVKMLMGGISNESFAARLKANRSDRLAWEINGLKPYPWFKVAKPLRKLKQFL